MRVVTFDLDNTIWKTSAVIGSANDALADHLDEIGIETTVRIEKIMGTLFKRNKEKYCPVLAQDTENGTTDSNLDVIKAPVLLTQLRKDAIMEVLLNQVEPLQDKIETISDKAFNVWTNARHDAIPLNFASSVLECLDEIRKMKTGNGNDVVVGAITDGNSDPRKVQLLRRYFDFVVNAESVGISKPDRRIYEAAIQLVSSDEKLRHVFDGVDEDDFDALLEKVGPWWVHIGDDFVKDIVAAKDLNMRSIWCQELIKDKQSSKELVKNTSGPQKIEADLDKEMSQSKIQSRILRSDGFLSNSISNEFADAIVDSFSEVCKVISSWHDEGIAFSGIESNEVDLPDYFTIVLPDEKKNDS